MSRHQEAQSAAIARIPKEEFERLIESDNPPTVTELARIGRGQPAKPKKRPRRLATCPHCGGDLTISDD